MWQQVREKVGVRRSGRPRPQNRLKLHIEGRCVDKFVLQKSGLYDFEAKVFAAFVLTNIWLLTHELTHRPTTVVQDVTLLTKSVRAVSIPSRYKGYLYQTFSGIPQSLRINSRTESQTRRRPRSSSSFLLRPSLLIYRHLQRTDNTVRRALLARRR
jgi:hypothetical protein